MTIDIKRTTNAQQWLKNHSCPAGQQRFLAGTLAEIMKNQTAIIFTLILTTLFSCKNDRKFPEVKKLSEYKNTQFIPTLEHKISN